MNPYAETIESDTVDRSLKNPRQDAWSVFCAFALRIVLLKQLGLNWNVGAVFPSDRRVLRGSAPRLRFENKIKRLGFVCPQGDRLR